MSSLDVPSSDTSDFIGRTTSLEEIVVALSEHGCSNLTTSINLTTCTELPLTGGGFCDVYQGAITDGTKVALKTLRVFSRPGKDNDGQKILKRATRELYNWSRLEHPNILPLMGFALFRGHLTMVSEWMENGSLMAYVRLNPGADRAGLCVDVCAGLCYIHSKGMVHGDLKSANVMISPNGRAMIADFGNSRVKDVTLKFTNTTSSSLSVRWAAPELLLQDGGPVSSKEADVYAYGMTALEALTGKVPYEGVSEQRLLGLVAYEHKPPSRPIVGIDDKIWDVLLLCWTWEAPKRPTIANVYERLQGLPTYSFANREATENIPSSPDSYIQETQSTGTSLGASGKSLQGQGSYSPPIGIVRLWIQRAKNVKKIGAILGDRSDPYVRVLLNAAVVACTEVKTGSPNPEWDEILYVPVHSLHEALYLQCVDYMQFTKHRSLGFVRLPVSDLVRATGDPRVPYSGTGRRDVVDTIRIGEGELHYTAEFFPAAILEDVDFVELDDGHRTIRVRGSKTEYTGGSTESHDEGSASSSSGKGRTKITLTSANSSEDKLEETPRTGVAGWTEELLAKLSGVIVFNVIDCEIAKPARLEILLDGGSWPVFATGRTRSTKARWNQVGEGFVKDLEFGRVWLRLNRARGESQADILAEYKLDAKPFMEHTLNGPTTFKLANDNGQDVSVVRIETKYFPIEIKLDPRELMDDMGILHVDLIDGRELYAADRSGKSDPFVVFNLNNFDIYKSSTKRKSLEPEWNERFDITVISRISAEFSLEVFDWNRIEAAKSLGSGRIELAGIRPMESTIHTIKLTSPKHGEKGIIRLRMIFRPEIIIKKHTKMPSFAPVGPAITQAGDNNTLDNLLKAWPSTPVVESASTSGLGTLRVTVYHAQNLSGIEEGDTIRPFVNLQIGDRGYKSKHVKGTAPEWNEVFAFPNTTTEIRTLHIIILDKKTFGMDHILAEGAVDIWRYIKPLSTPPILSAEVTAPLNDNGGALQLRLDLEPASILSIRTTSISGEPSPYTSRSEFSPS